MQASLSNLRFHDLEPPRADFRAAVLAGLAAQPKQLAPKFFYDEHGSDLFERITRVPEYYPTRTEIALLRRHGAEIARHLGDDGLLIELGSASDTKIRVLFDALQPRVYAPIDIAREPLLAASAKLARDYAWLRVHPVCADYTQPLDLSVLPQLERRAAFYPGSSIGNFEPTQARDLLRRIQHLLGPRGRLLVGVDLKKDPARLTAAYNDAQGVTAAFNLNLLARINRELGADFDLAAFRHEAFYDEPRGRVEMHLVACAAGRVNVAGRAFEFAAGESIHSENSYKYGVEEFRTLAAQAGWTSLQVWQDADQLFSVHCLAPG